VLSTMHAESVADHSIRCPYVDVLAQGTIRSPCDAERRKRRPVLVATGIKGGVDGKGERKNGKEEGRG